jgi:hypothetical protein
MEPVGIVHYIGAWPPQLAEIKVSTCGLEFEDYFSALFRVLWGPRNRNWL